MQRYQQICMTKTLNALGAAVPDPTQDGPYSILKDGNRMLKPLDLICVPVPRVRLFSDGRYVVHKTGHFFGLIVMYTNVFVLVDDGEPEFIISDQVVLRRDALWKPLESMGL